MKTSALVPFAVLASAVTAFAQGPLTPPPGAPAPLMKSLDQIEARTPLVAGQEGVSINANGTIIISESGSYYLTENLTLTAASASGIVVQASHVTLDLNGFSLTHTTGAGGDAVVITASNVTVLNGSIRGGTTVAGSTFTPAGWDEGITTNSAHSNLVVRNVSVAGARTNGIFLSYQGSRVESCSVNTVGGIGILASSISFSTARKTGNTAIAASSDPDSGSVSDCFGECIAPTGGGISAPDGTISNSRGISVGSIGINAKTASNCYGSSESGTGMNAATANNCRGISTSGTGFSGTCLINCHGQSTSGNFGISATLATSCVASRSGGVALSANTANGCHISAGTVTATNKYNMP